MAFHFSARSGAIGALLLAAGCMAGESTGGSPELGGSGANGGGIGAGASQLVSVTNLTSDQSSLAGNVNASLVNAWGIVGFQGWFWIADEATGKLSILDGTGKPAVAQQPGNGNGMGQGMLNVSSDSIDLGEGITGIAVNTSTEMQMDGKGDKAQVCGPANLIVASEKGQLIGVNTDLNQTGGQVLVDRSSVGAAYLGVAVLDIKPGAMCSATGGDCDTIGMGSGSGSGSAGAGSGSGSDNAGTGTGNGNGNGNAAKPGILVLAADFHNARIDVFDEKFNLVTTPMFSTPSSIPAGFAPFNVAVINGFVYVSFAQQNEEKDDSVAGAGLGFVVAFDVCGNVQWIAKGNELNAPWGMVMSGNPARGSLLVGNFGDGHITELNPKDGTIIGQLMTADNAPVTIDGLWGLALGTGPGLAVQSAKTDGVYFTAGPEDETHGVFGVITAAVTTPGPGSGSGSGM